MTPHTATAVGPPNIALIKYWGNLDPELRLPANGSISMTLSRLETRTKVTFDARLPSDALAIDGRPAEPDQAARASRLLDRIRGLSGGGEFARIESWSNFPSGVGIASSASAFSALALAGAAAAGLDLDRPTLSSLARTASGSACRSVYSGYVEWAPGDDHKSSTAHQLHPSEHWRLVDLIAVVSRKPKRVGSSDGHALAATSPLQEGRLRDAPRRLDRCRRALQARDFSDLAEVVEQDSNLMHAVMMTSSPPLLYWEPASLRLMHAIASWRGSGLRVCYTLDAGPTVHALCLPKDAGEVEARLRQTRGVLEVLRAETGEGARRVGPSEDILPRGDAPSGSG